MKKILICLLVLIISIFIFTSCSANKPITEWNERNSDDLVVMSYNIRFDTWKDMFKKDWDSRKSGLTDQIATICPDVIGMQEVESNQFDYMAKRFADKYDSVVAYRDGEEEGEASPIFYNRNRFDLIDSGSFWLSETPNVVSMGWDATHNRICTYAKLFDKTKDKNIVVYNTHLDNIGEISKVESIKLILSKIVEMATPSILIGDFNFKENDDAYNLVIEDYDNAKYKALETMNKNTYNGFGEKELLIDHCFITKNDFVVNKYEINTEKDGKSFYSDHYPLIVTLEY